MHRPHPRAMQATVEHRSPQAVAVTLAGKKWEVAHDFGRKVCGRCGQPYN